MSYPIIERPKGLDGLVTGSLLAAGILILSILVSAPAMVTFGVLAASLALLYLYMRLTRRVQPETATAYAGENHLRNRLQDLSEVADAFPRAVAILDRNGVVVHANSAAQSLLSPDMVDRPVGAYLRNSELKSRLDQAFAGEPVPSLSVHVLEPTERVVDVDFSSPHSIQHNEEKNELIFAVLADRTEANLSREKRADFLANASHELKTPIASLKGYIETLRGHAKDDPEARELFLGIMQEQAERMERLVTDLLSLRKIESSEHIAPSEKADLRQALITARDVLEPLASARDVALDVEIATPGPAMISGKADECVQLFLNLIENAIKLSPAGMRVTVTLEHLPKWTGEAFRPPVRQGAALRRIVNLAPSDSPVWRVIISDSGPGFSRAHLPRIGERFYRIAGDLPAQEKGTGLGLAIVKHVVLRHRAGLFVLSAHKDDPVYYGRDAGTTVRDSGTAFSVIFAEIKPHETLPKDEEISA